MRVDEEFDRVRAALRTEQDELAREFDQIDAEARAAVDATIEHARTELATQADRIRAAIARQREEVEASSQEFRAEVENGYLDVEDADSPSTDGPEPVDPDDEPPTDVDGAHPSRGVEQPDGTDVDQVTPRGDEPQEVLDGEVERGD